MLHFIFVVFHASSAFHVLHISIPILQTKEAEASSSTETMHWSGQPRAKSHKHNRYSKASKASPSGKAIPFLGTLSQS